MERCSRTRSRVVTLANASLVHFFAVFQRRATRQAKDLTAMSRCATAASSCRGVTLRACSRLLACSPASLRPPALPLRLLLGLLPLLYMAVYTTSSSEELALLLFLLTCGGVRVAAARCNPMPPPPPPAPAPANGCCAALPGTNRTGKWLCRCCDVVPGFDFVTYRTECWYSFKSLSRRGRC